MPASKPLLLWVFRTTRFQPGERGGVNPNAMLGAVATLLIILAAEPAIRADLPIYHRDAPFSQIQVTGGFDS